MLIANYHSPFEYKISHEKTCCTFNTAMSGNYTRVVHQLVNIYPKKERKGDPAKSNPGNKLQS